MSGSISFSVFCCQLGAMSWDEGGLARVLLQDLDNSGVKHNIYNNNKSWSIEIKANTVWAIEHTHEKFTCVSSLCLDLQHVYSSLSTPNLPCCSSHPSIYISSTRICHRCYSSFVCTVCTRSPCYNSHTPNPLNAQHAICNIVNRK